MRTDSNLRITRVLLLGLAMFLLAAARTTAAQYYVAPNGNDGNSGSSWGRAFRTIQKGIDSCEAPDPEDPEDLGDTVNVAEGTYYENIDFTDKIPCTVIGTTPLDPDVVSRTIIDGGWNGSVVTFGPTEEQDFEDPEALPFVLEGFTITNGLSDFGGGVYCEEVFAIVRHCHIVNNEAYNIDGFSGDGGGVYIQTSAAQFISCWIMNNYSEWDGGGVLCTEVITGDFEEQTGTMFVNCLIVNNQTLGYGGAMYLDESAPVITLSTIVGNTGYYDPIDDSYGGIYAVDSTPEITNCIIWNNGDDLYECSATYSCIEDDDDGEGNIDDNPLFVTGPLSDYYLSQPPDQLDESPCVNAGVGTIRDYVDYDLGQVTTSTTNAADAVVVDMGYHYNYYIGPTIFYELRIIVVGPGTTHPAAEPDSHFYPMWTRVQVTAMPEPGYRVQQWVGTDESSWDLINHVTMSSDKTVYCYFEPDISTIRHVPGDYTNIQNAIDDARDGDTVLVATGLYHTSWGYEIGNKAITISSTKPDDPWVVANTIIEMEAGAEGSVRSAFIFTNVGPDTVLKGFTIRGFNITGLDGLDGDADPYYDGEPGSSVSGSAIICTFASPMIKNCIITDCSANGGSGGTGTAGDDDHIDGGHGGWPGGAYGGGIACMYSSDPNIINCTFNNCSAIGGDGGDGGDGNDDPDDILDGRGGRGGGWYYSTPPDTPYEFGPFEHYTKYSGRGGAVYVDGTSSPIFTDCTFTNNNTDSGLCGICGINGWLPNLRDEPSINWDIDNFGGAVYTGGGSDAQFIGCEFSNNTASTEIVEDYYDAYVSYGGGVCYEEEHAMPTFTDCTFVGNEAAVGGGMFFWEQSNPTVTNCNFVNNIAYQGGGIFAAESFGTIQGCTISGNQATTGFAPPGVEGIYGQGAGIFCTGGPGMFEHCLITGNTADMSGGGIYFGGTEAEPITPTLYNCLVTDNVAGRDGGGISCDWFSQPSIINCTISGNAATGGPPFGTGYGGGLYCSYESNANLINSILWGNSGTGQSIALATEYDPDPRPATLTVQYCDVQGGQQAVWVEQGCTLNWLEGNIDTDPLFVDGYYLSQIAAGQAEDSLCVNAGSAYAEAIGLHRHSTRTDGAPDAGTVDMGYHYEMLRLLSCDFDFDWDVDLADLKVLLSYWLQDDCSSLDWCEGVDFNSDSRVDFADYAICAGQYSPSDETSPQPDPATWAVEPNAISSSAVSMTATTATDESAVEYYFQCTQGTEVGGDNSGWQDNPNYVDTGLSVGVTYCYKVKTRDKSWRQNETGWSTEQCATPADIYPPEPDPSTWDIEPYETSAFTISMTATTATDPSGVEYYFECTSGPGQDSGWQVSQTYTDSVVADETDYCYTVKTRDMDENETTPSEESCVWVDHCAPQPAPTWDTPPAATSPFSIIMTASDANDPSGGVQYYFECTAAGGHDSGWRDDPNYVDTGLTELTTYTYRVRTRDTHNNISEYSAPASAATPADLQVPSPDPSTWAVEPRAVLGSSDSVTMTASMATDPSGVEYYFDCTSPGGHDSGWRDDPTYVDTGLSVETTYCYTVKTRDKSVNQNETGQSEERCAFIDITPPTPDPSEWQTMPYQYEDSGKYYHRMVAKTASDISSVEYWFDCVGGGGGSTAWQDSPIHEVEVPGPNLVWSYRVKARDKSSNHNETAYSNWGVIGM